MTCIQKTFFQIGSVRNSFVITSRLITIKASVFKLQQISLNIEQRRLMSGHSHWANIKRGKAADDMIKAKKRVEFSNKVAIAVKVHGSTDPKFNLELARLLDAGKRTYNIPNDYVKGLLENLKKRSVEVSDFIAEAKGPSNSIFLIRCSPTEGNIKHLLRKIGLQEAQPGTQKHLFEHKGYVFVDMEGNKEPDMDKYTEIAIESGAEDVALEQDGELCALKFICDPNDLQKVTVYLQRQELKVISSEDVFTPMEQLTLSDIDLKFVSNAVEKLESSNIVLDITTNVQNLPEA